MREIVGHLSISSSRGLGGVREVLEAGNVAFNNELNYSVFDSWGYGLGINWQRFQWPWRLQPGLANNPNLYHGHFGQDSSLYPGNQGSTITSLYDGSHQNASFSPGDSYASSFGLSFVIGAVGALNSSPNPASSSWESNVMSITDVPTTQLGPSYVHPVFTGTATITAGSPFLTSLSLTTGNGYFYQYNYTENSSVVRIESGPDKGVYYVVLADRNNSRISLRTPDGVAFNPTSTQSGVSVSVGCRPSYFNETSVIPNGTGTVAFSGLFNPGVNNSSYICKIHFEKSGNCTPGSQQGSYWFSLRNWVGGNGNIGDNGYNGQDGGALYDGFLGLITGTNSYGVPRWNNGAVALVGSCTGIQFDQANQRMWFTTTDTTNGDIGFWFYKTPENVHELASTTGTPPSASELTSPINMTGTVPYANALGSDNTFYASLTTQAAGNENANAGIVAISTGLTPAVARTTTEWGLGVTSHHLGITIDRTRFRTGTAGDVTTTAATNQLNSTSGAFSSKDLGRLIQVTGGSHDNAIYKITTINSTTQVVVTTPTGGAVSFTGGTGGTFNIGDRIYLFWNDTVTVSNAVYYVESLQISTLLHFTVTLTNGKQILSGGGYQYIGTFATACVDPVSGVLYWSTRDSVEQINRFDPSTNTYNQIPMSYFSGLNGGVGTTPPNPTYCFALGVNSNSAFRELWIGTDNSIIRIPTIDSQTWASPTYQRYYGAATGSSAQLYAKPANMWKTCGDDNVTYATTTGIAIQFDFGIDGRVWAVLHPSGSGNCEPVSYIRDSDNFAPSGSFTNPCPGSSIYVGCLKIDPYGGAIFLNPYSTSAQYMGLVLFGAQIHYQWNGTNWFPQEVVRGPVPDSGTSSPGCLAKPLHTAAAPLVMGVQVAFTPQGGATPPNNEFLGRLGQVTGYGGNDGTMDATTGVSHTFTGSGFTTSDVGRLLYITSGSQIGVYAITAYNSGTSITVRQYGNASFTGNGTSSLTYTVWDQNAQGNAGPEVCSLYWANGFGKDNTQDINNIYYEMFLMKTILSEQVESIKFMCPLLGAPGAAATSLSAGINGASGTGLANGVSVYYEYFNRSGAQYEPGVPAMRAVPATGIYAGDGTQLLDNFIDRALGGSDNYANAWGTQTDTTWYGNIPSTAVGNAWVFDLGASVQVGSILVRGYSNGGTDASMLMYTENQNGNGLLAEWLNETTAGTAPGNASTVRTSGSSNLSLTNNTTTISLSSGNFLGSSLYSHTTGTTVAGASTFSDTTNSPFTVPTSGSLGSLGQVIQLTSGSDVGYFRIIGVTSTSVVTIRALTQVAYTWVGTATGTLSYTVWNAVQEEDMIAVTTSGHTQHRLCVELLLQATVPSTVPTTAQVRIPPNETFGSLSWNCVQGTWNVVTRVEYSVQGVPPEVTNNGTWMSEDGLEDSVTTGTSDYWKMYASLSGVSALRATGRYWKLAMMPRFNNNLVGSQFWMASVHFYDPSGNPIGQTSYNMLDVVTSQPNFFCAKVYRHDIIQAADYAAPQNGDANGLASLGGTTGNTVTLAGGNQFLGFQVRPAGANGSAPGGNNVFNSTSADPPFTAADVNRFLNIQSGPNSGGTTDGYYRILTVVSATQVTVASPAGNTVTFSADAGPTSWSVYEGINVGTANPDFIAFAATDLRTGGNYATIPEYSIATISDNLQTLTLNVPQYTTLSNQHWEIRRRGNVSTSSSTDSTLSSRSLFNGNGYPFQSGDIAQDSRGFLKFWPFDVGNGNQRTNGATSATGTTFTGSGFTQDDVGRILVIQTGGDKGAYKISAYISTTQVTLAAIYPTVTFTGFANNASSLNYVVYGERRFRMSRYTTCLRA
jgi:hypothetical protein